METPSPIAEIGLLIYPDCQLAAVYGLTDLFRIAGDRTSQEVAAGAEREIRVSHWQVGAPGDEVACVWDSHPGTPHRLSYAIAPPSIIMPDRMAPMRAAADWMKDRHAGGTTVCSICAGAFVLAESGLIDGRQATTHWAFAAQLTRRFPEIEVIEERMLVDEGDIITAGGILAWTDLGLTLVERLLGASTMLATARFLLVDPPRRQQQPFARFIPRFDHGDDKVLRAQQFMHAHAREAQSVAALAAQAGMSERTFLRRFGKATGLRPKDYLQQVRLAKAREALERTGQPVDQIAWQIGYQDPAAFRKAFLKQTGLSPGTYRRRFGIA
ncbi:GlxA family transcriptional regulator [Acidimangrovimonas sediminis]|uniref:GlxA family transcriptional regulator n=1 Tax=Acidimangrovimonas sediminis TaxID=2056283 RepID=UPI000C80C8CD|nr:GlxA family transcriptional regulator [Acidimangrovimonas sediminis]